MKTWKHLVFVTALVGSNLLVSNLSQAEGFIPRWGAKTSLGFSSFTGDTNGAEFGLGLGLGPTASFDIDRYSVAVDLLFSRKSYDYPGYSIRTWDITVPVVGRFYPHPLWFGEFGAFFSYGVGSVSHKDDAGFTSSRPYGASDVGRGDFGLVFGGGADMALGSGSFQPSFRFNWGFSDRNKDPIFSAKTLNFELQAAYFF